MLAIIGGTGVYRMPEIEITGEHRMDTPFGQASSAVVKGRVAGRDVLFLARHGENHQYLPHEVNYRANLFALKSLGATQVIGISAVGSLQQELGPGDLAIPEQYFDWTKGRRASTFFGGGIAAHVSTAYPVSASLTHWIKAHAESLGIRLHTGVTYACVEGPRLGTRAESLFLRQAGCHLVGMTNVPEVFLAREAQLCYATIGIVTDYDCWLDDPAQHVQANAIFALYTESLKKVYRLLDTLLSDELPPEEPEIRNALSSALLTPEVRITPEQQAWLQVLQR
jgi:5'-methylthioadenosine phosphorylase